MRRPLLATLAFFIFAAATAVAAPPAGRPPKGALERYAPERYHYEMEVSIRSQLVRRGTSSYQDQFEFNNTPIFVPVVFQNTWSRIDPTSLNARLWMNSREDVNVNDRGRLEEGYPFSTQLATIVLPAKTNAQYIRWTFGYDMQVWSSRINDEAAMAEIPWPREWPEEVRAALQPQMYIESNAQIFKDAVQTVSEGRLRLVPPWYAAKDIVRYCIANIRTTGLGSAFGDQGQLVSLDMEGALTAARNQLGSPHDLVCACVAMLRAADIPARPVVGIQKVDDSDQIRFDSWLEFYLPDAGWIPVDPMRMRDHGVRHRDVKESWPYFGNIDDLNQRIPLAFHFHPPTRARLINTHEYRDNVKRLRFQPSVWAWRPGNGDVQNSSQKMDFKVTYLGTGTDIIAVPPPTDPDDDDNDK